MLQVKKNNFKKKILIVCPFPENEVPGQRLKYEQYFSHWRANGFDLTIKPFVSKKFMQIIYNPGKFHYKFLYTISGYLKRFILLFSIKKYDIVYVFLWVTPFGIPFFEKIYSTLSKKLIYDIDDMVFLPHKSQANAFFSFLKGKSKPIVLMKKADHVITCTPKLDEFVRQYNKNTTDISSTVDTLNRYTPVNEYKNDHKIILGWSGSHSTSKYLYLLADILRELYQEVPFKLIVMGDKNFYIDKIEMEAHDWSENIEISTLQKFDIGLYPLPNEEWVYGKSGLKAIQYMALGVPTIATAIGANYRIINDGENGYLVDVHHLSEWKNRIKTLMEDPELRKKMGLNARKTIQEKYSIAANQDKYLRIFNEL